MRSSDKRRGALGRLAIIIMMVLVLAFLVSVAPVSGAKPKYCSDSCGKKLKSDPGPQDCWHEHTETRICKTSRGVKWLIQDRDCCNGYYYKICHHRAWCDNTGACAEVGAGWEKVIGHWKTCDKWEKRYEYR